MKAFLCVSAIIILAALLFLVLMEEAPKEPPGEWVEYKLDKPMRVEPGYNIVFGYKVVEQGFTLTSYWVFIYDENNALVDQAEAREESIEREFEGREYPWQKETSTNGGVSTVRFLH